MNTPQQTESIKNLFENIEKGNIVLPEFQRDFVWEVKKSIELFDSLVRDIFIGSIIYGKPTFEITVREMDTRPRKGEGSRKKLQITSYDEEEINLKSQIANFRLILDGQQRATSIYRALKGIDEIWYIGKNDEELTDTVQKKEYKNRSLEEMLFEFSLQEDESRISIRLSEAYEISNGDMLDEDIKEKYFDKLSFLAGMDALEIRENFRRYKTLCTKLGELFKSDLLLSYYLLNMDNEKFALFFERSNSKGIQLNFIDILAAKLYKGFNLRDKIDELGALFPNYNFDREIIVRTISYIVSNGKDIDRNFILTNLNYEHFNKYWDEICSLYNQVLDFLFNENLIISQNWMPYENMVIPLMIFLRESNQKDFSQMNESQYEFLKYWYWASILSQRYSSGSNEAILQDSMIFKSIASNERITDRVFFTRLKLQIDSYEDILSYSKKVNVIYKGILNLINFNAKGLSDWNNSSKLSKNKKLEDHHIFPKEYVKQQFKNDEQAISLIDCVANRTLIPKITNIKVGKKAPSKYMSEIKDSNYNFEKTLIEHLVPVEIIEGLYDEFYYEFIDERAKSIFNLIKNNVIDKEKSIIEQYYQQPKIKGKGNIKIFATYHKRKLEATLDFDSQKVLLLGESHSISSAADKAKHTLTGKSDTSTNGWKFWKYIDENGKEKFIDNLRKRTF
ncbi:DUF262 domain-containing protein [Bacillus sp. FJAT-27445]|uniref:GmrSD restriction endonuclease domain-containing protein n=1 Tax=Bacillus sp. FJAT-27445 TaxID=1679166 RepID=UPI0007439A26|nr:DUF262 domain-containing protein [Bacillus sp. FJAT-27445]